MTEEEREEERKQNADWKKEHWKRKLGELVAEEQDEQRKRNVDQKKAYRERKLNQSKEQRNRIIE